MLVRFGSSARALFRAHCTDCPECLTSLCSQKLAMKLSNGAPSESTSRLKKIDLIPARLHRHLFGENERLPVNTVEKDLFENLELPDLEGSNLLEHFHYISSKQFEGYQKLLAQAAVLNATPPLPEKWAFQVGWTMYDSEDGTSKKVLV